jgi:hypothetical protein
MHGTVPVAPSYLNAGGIYAPQPVERELENEVLHSKELHRYDNVILCIFSMFFLTYINYSKSSIFLENFQSRFFPRK